MMIFFKMLPAFTIRVLTLTIELYFLLYGNLDLPFTLHVARANVYMYIII